MWPTVPANHPAEPALDVLASVLGGISKGNRLFRALIYDRQIATEVEASHPTFSLAGQFEVDLVAKSGQTLDELVRLADLEIERLKMEGPTADEVRKVQIERERSQIMELESVTSKATVLNHYQATVGDPLAYRSILSKIFAVTPEDVRRVARQYLGERRIRLDVTPGARVPRPSDVNLDHARARPQSSARSSACGRSFQVSTRASLGESRSLGHARGRPAAFVYPACIKRRRLTNGLELRIVERHEPPVVTVKLVVKSGETSTPRGKEGLGSIAISLLDEGTKSRSALQLEGEQLEIGASLALTDGWNRAPSA